MPPSKIGRANHRSVAARRASASPRVRTLASFVSTKTKRPTKAPLETELHVRLRIVCLSPPDARRHDAEFGLQDNSTTADWVIHPGQVQPNGDVHFECECRVRPQPRTGTPNFLGPFVHGGSAQRFLYLSWRPQNWRPGRPEPACPTWVRRMKVHLSSISAAQIAQAQKTGGVLEASVAGTGRDGGPNCASVPLLGRGWTVRKK